MKELKDIKEKRKKEKKYQEEKKKLERELEKKSFTFDFNGKILINKSA